MSFDKSNDFNQWRKSLTPTRERVAIERALRKFKGKPQWDEEGCLIIDSRQFHLYNSKGEVIPNTYNRESLQYILFNEFSIMYHQDMLQGLSRLGLIAKNGVNDDGTVHYVNGPTDHLSVDAALSLWSVRRRG